MIIKDTLYEILMIFITMSVFMMFILGFISCIYYPGFFFKEDFSDISEWNVDLKEQCTMEELKEVYFSKYVLNICESRCCLIKKEKDKIKRNLFQVSRKLSYDGPEFELACKNKLNICIERTIIIDTKIYDDLRKNLSISFDLLYNSEVKNDSLKLNIGVTDNFSWVFKLKDNPYKLRSQKEKFNIFFNGNSITLKICCFDEEITISDSYIYIRNLELRIENQKTLFEFFNKTL